MKQKATRISHEHKPFWQLSRLGDFAVSRNANLFVHEKLMYLIPRTNLFSIAKKVLRGKKREYDE